MTLRLPKRWILLIFALFALLLLFSRFYNVDRTARFVWDESSDLVRMHQIFDEKNLTLIGPISEDGNKVFGSLTYYMLLPFTILGNFDPLSPTLGAAFWGVVTAFLVVYLAARVNKNILLFILPIAVFWYPLVETGRWAWNPNLIPFWVTLALIFYLRKSIFSKFLSGAFMGLALHHHYLSGFAILGMALVILFTRPKKIKAREFFSFSAGAFLAILPFVVFDLTHPPGLFLSRILYFNYLGGPGEKVSLLKNLVSVVDGTFGYFTQSNLFKAGLFASWLALIYTDIKSRSKALPFAAVFLVQILGLLFVKDFYVHYVLPAVPFFLLYLIYPRKALGKTLSYLSLSVLLLSSLFSFPKQITKVTWEGDIASVKYMARTIEQKIKENDLKNANLAVLSSPDPNTYGRRFRDLLLLKGVNLRTKEEYQISDALFVITTANSEALRTDPAYEMNSFRNGPLVESWEVPDSEWRIFLFSKPI
ncbi:MAG: hypothetical protein UX95_C0023G0003 [Candidatus Woesebacteria bacterium GW2011_GWD1_47_21]|uniref:Glycosyltransferase RgtA/B/C/D-like domain-containing protein n=4 Tax=Candidatus Woeseibacteriota TaxID=1752722 RepID=A0A0G1SLF4_9BACT|nr:MAG: hypothetical protein UX03_C0028G0003 [Candidatus Woesebacteria bacterium GW2011_GWE1_45_18]KKU70329.1 MAG: hypothetical protein UX95_C0023G0003 [Candidatus Woesebacteria bacterium GW2011_GWD1_47_21]OGM77341.1 MAG: hypothetical protein A2197_00610 [Candidatus Woesebacteria bacterium RIFOXYA1_FULL_48_16]OGM82169.1 MAG: hypothetical protein A2376_03040 [Candidatus Woesebacteria bacterium RIFOXYB1_FULL_47_31]